MEDKVRMNVLKEDVDYYTYEQLRNPLLLWLMSESGGNMIQMADPSTIEYYEQHVLHDPQNPLIEETGSGGYLAWIRLAEIQYRLTKNDIINWALLYYFKWSILAILMGKCI